MRIKWNMGLLIVALALLLSGCSVHTVDELYCLPKRSEKYNNLQTVIRAAMGSMDYSAPHNGENQQTVQTVDLNGDGLNEFLVFAKGTADKPLNIFVLAGDGENYQLVDTISSTGYAFDQVEYIQMDDRPGYEIVVGRQVSDQVARSVSVYTLVDGQVEQLMNASYSQFLTCDLDRNGCSELFILRQGEGERGVASVYFMKGGNLERSQEASMSEPVENIKRIMVSKLYDGVSAVYVASEVTGSDGIITDVYTLSDGQLRNVSLSNESGTSVQTLRNYYVYADDMDGDGVLELPSLITMKTGEEDVTGGSQYIIRWYSMDSEGREVDKLYTYHNFVGGWYLQLDSQIAPRFCVTQMGSSYEFSLWDETFTQREKLMTVYVLTGQKREEQAVADNRFILSRGEATIYAANLEVASATYGIGKDEMMTSFHLIVEEWNTSQS